MGEAKQRQRWRDKFLAEHLKCCFCSGNRPATTIDHVPSRQLFRQKDRPQGLEVPACETCNHRTSLHEQVAALLCRSYPDITNEQEQKELENIVRRVRNNNPGLLEEILSTTRKQRHDGRKMLRDAGIDDAVPVNASGPLLNETMQSFGTKMGLAFHYLQTGKIVPEAGGVVTAWFTNYDRAIGEFPFEVVDDLPEFRALKQGRKSTAGDFEYSWSSNDTGVIGIYAATFRRSFAVFAGIAHDASDLPQKRTINRSFL